MKKIAAIGMALCLCAGLAACSGQSAEDNAGESVNAGAVSEQEESAFEGDDGATVGAPEEAAVEFEPVGHYVSGDMDGASMDILSSVIEMPLSADEQKAQSAAAAGAAGAANAAGAAGAADVSGAPDQAAGAADALSGAADPAGAGADGTAGSPDALQEDVPAETTGDPSVYYINIGIHRLISLSGTATYQGGVMAFTATADVNPEDSITGQVVGHGEYVTVIIEESQWEYLASGTVLNFYRQDDSGAEEAAAAQ